MNLEVRRLTKRYRRVPVVDNASFCVKSGEITGYLGPNGSGKTTTMRLVLGLLRPLAGRITVLGNGMPEDAPRVLARLGYVPEQPHLDSTLTVREIINFQAAFYRTWDWPCAEDLVRRFDLDEHGLFARLSKGQKAKLMILLALAQRGELLVLDEPTDGLDPVVRRDILSALLEYVSQRKATIFISSHLVHELERFCDWVAVMDDGRVVTEVPMEKLKQGTKRLMVAGAPASLGATPFVVLSRERANGATERWIVGKWEPEMTSYFEGVGASLVDVIDLDLEDGFVELLRSFRAARG